MSTHNKKEPESYVNVVEVFVRCGRCLGAGLEPSQNGYVANSICLICRGSGRMFEREERHFTKVRLTTPAEVVKLDPPKDPGPA